MLEFFDSPGSYALSIRVPESKWIVVGALGKFKFPAGDYLYCGSAMGPGGIGGRIKHHILPKRKPHWHIDYLLETGSFNSAWYIGGKERQECHWALTLNRVYKFDAPVNGFGSSDCQAGCISHLLLIPGNYSDFGILQLLSSISGKEASFLETGEFLHFLERRNKVKSGTHKTGG